MHSTGTRAMHCSSECCCTSKRHAAGRLGAYRVRVATAWPSQPFLSRGIGGTPVCLSANHELASGLRQPPWVTKLQVRDSRCTAAQEQSAAHGVKHGSLCVVYWGTCALFMRVYSTCKVV
jgi:hypothetical protein